jgi:phosphoribosylformylglycinamidine cyclo-ligase
MIYVATDNILLSSTIGRNKNLITGEVFQPLSTEELIKELDSLGGPFIQLVVKLLM